jgi:chemotaxis protein CheC
MSRGSSPDVPAGLTDSQRDALCELTNIGAGHGAAALSRLLAGDRIGFPPPEAREATTAELADLLGGAGAPRLAATVEVHGDAAGALWLVLAPEAADLLLARLASPEAPELALRRAVERVADSALAAMGRFTGLVLEPGAPLLRRAGADALAASRCRGGPVRVLAAHLHAPGFTAQFLFLPDAASVPLLLRALRV